MNKIFYYDNVTENLFAEEDAEETCLEELIEEAYELPDDDISYVGIVSNTEDKYKIKSDAYNSYKIYKFDTGKAEYIIIDLGDFEKVKMFLGSFF
jgi:hypothetical protein